MSPDLDPAGHRPTREEIALAVETSEEMNTADEEYAAELAAAGDEQREARPRTKLLRRPRPTTWKSPSRTRSPCRAVEDDVADDDHASRALRRWRSKPPSSPPRRSRTWSRRSRSSRPSQPNRRSRSRTRRTGGRHLKPQRTPTSTRESPVAESADTDEPTPRRDRHRDRRSDSPRCSEPHPRPSPPPTRRSRRRVRPPPRRTRRWRRPRRPDRTPVTATPAGRPGPRPGGGRPSPIPRHAHRPAPRTRRPCRWCPIRWRGVGPDALGSGRSGRHGLRVHRRGRARRRVLAGR